MTALRHRRRDPTPIALRADYGTAAARLVETEIAAG
jgi:hypothetical protein